MRKLTFHEAVKFLKNGFLVVLPTETVYGLAADGMNVEAVSKLFKLKARPLNKPIMLQVSDISMMSDIVSEIPKEAEILIKYFWPGPLTIVLPKKLNISDLLSAGTGNIGVRMPDHPITLKIIKEVGRPLAVPSANLSGKRAPISAEEVEKSFFLSNKKCISDLAGIVDFGVCKLGEASTVLDLVGCCRNIEAQNAGDTSLNRNLRWKILREGPIKFDQIAALIGQP